MGSVRNVCIFLLMSTGNATTAPTRGSLMELHADVAYLSAIVHTLKDSSDPAIKDIVALARRAVVAADPAAAAMNITAHYQVTSYFRPSVDVAVAKQEVHDALNALPQGVAAAVIAATRAHADFMRAGADSVAAVIHAILKNPARKRCGPWGG